MMAEEFAWICGASHYSVFVHFLSVTLQDASSRIFGISPDTL
jgi:hypothetical protein